ncbi:MAG: transcription termination factor NusA [Chlorobi bacterium]|nr:MAG: transcription termination factor NusA [Bacteroidota bacterium]KXK34358.1 MAG: transcription elongation factor [Chlorobi bacterium OLB6]MBE2265179.1 transcription termination factor NusA [Flavobacteriales bacterium]MBL1160180.1 transcription termination factor NusA [Chlorobiota bacterium]MBW7853318.1 transcription termination factor NusA [Candidatus Kapabacteria bacterium]MCC6332214.1 transcription termination factor NusA [Ignavibacteria bacterium]
MAKRKVKQKVDNKKLIIDAFAEMAREKSIDRDLLQGIVEETLKVMVRKKYGENANFDCIVNMDKGDIEIYLMKEVVEVVEDPETQISQELVKEETGDTLDIGDEFIQEITLENISDSFGRRLVSQAIQNLNQRIRDVEKDNIYEEYSKRVGEVIIGEIYQVRPNNILVMHNKIEMRLPREEQIPTERLKKNQQIKAILKEVRRSGGATGLPDLILSRSDDSFMARLFEQEIPEIYDGIIEIKSIAREPGERAKVAVTSFDERVDPVGACVGMKGIRIHAIVRELSNENIDIIEYTDDTRLYIARSLSPAKVRDVQIDAENRQATVVVPDDQVSLAIGRNGVNVRLASKLTGYSLSLVKEGAEDIELFEFRDEIGADLYDLLIHEGIDTAREFLEADPVVLLRLLPKERILELRSVIHEEFDEREDPRWLRMLDEAENPGSADETTTTETDDDISEAYAEDTPLIDDSMDNEADEDGNEEPVQDDTDNTTEE